MVYRFGERSGTRACQLGIGEKTGYIREGHIGTYTGIGEPSSRMAYKNEEQPKPVLTISETSRLLRVHDNTIRRWSDQGIIKTYRIGPRGDRRFRREDVTELLIKRQKEHRG